jgi:hypothetical protein
MQTRWPGGSNRDAIRPPRCPVIEPLHNSLDEARRIRANIASGRASATSLFVRNMRFFWTVFLTVVALAWTLIWLCASISVYESDFSELKNIEIVFFLLMMLGLAASQSGRPAVPLDFSLSGTCVNLIAVYRVGN